MEREEEKNVKKGERPVLKYAAMRVRRDKWKFWCEDDDDGNFQV